MTKKLFALLLMGLLVCGQAKAADALDRIVAVVNDSPVMESELNHSIYIAKQQAMASGAALPKETLLHKQMLEQLIDKKLQLQLAEQNNIKITDEEIDQAIKNIAANNKIEVDELYQKLSEQGLEKNDYRNEIKEQITLHQVQQAAFAGKISVTEKEIENFLRNKHTETSSREYRLEDIVITLSDNASAAEVSSAKDRAERILAKINSGAAFASAGEVEDLGWRKATEIPNMFSSIMNHKAGEVVGPLRAPNGFHIIHLAEIKDSDQNMKLSELHEQAHQFLFQQKFEDEMKNWMKKMRSTAFIKIPQNLA